MIVSPRRLYSMTELKVPKSVDNWVVIGVWLASRELPTLPFWVPLAHPDTGVRLELAVPYKAIMATLNPKYNGRQNILLHTRVVQRVNNGKLEGEVRYLCTDLTVSYKMGDNAFKWIKFHPHMFQVCCSTWISSLSRVELQDHLALANSTGTRGTMVFQSAAAHVTRQYLQAILQGKGLRACSACSR
jgi:hypothetical protein